MNPYESSSTEEERPGDTDTKRRRIAKTLSVWVLFANVVWLVVLLYLIRSVISDFLHLGTKS